MTMDFNVDADAGSAPTTFKSLRARPAAIRPRVRVNVRLRRVMCETLAVDPAGARGRVKEEDASARGRVRSVERHE